MTKPTCKHCGEEIDEEVKNPEFPPETCIECNPRRRWPRYRDREKANEVQRRYRANLKKRRAA
ncbi:hypothetical protein [Methyloceanibacter caenitepidi]|uniref:Uncharacterized protein n=1 Tax=Methyloceanibacter caenitepidi TaxID=1384459 RepID=A0A0A8JZ41_9HYPH|nr:hypothetical protein [Methyloceanibacter caenitepidi]BAQ16073.1 hypothetical protein GL4_0610 [Methyloceanibacter caenitepidi]